MYSRLHFILLLFFYCLTVFCMFAMYFFYHIHPTMLSDLSSTPSEPLFSRTLLSCLLIRDSLHIMVHGYGVTYWHMDSEQGLCYWRKWPHPSITSNDLQAGPYGQFPTYGKMSTDPALCAFCAGDHRHSQLMRAMARSCPEHTILLHFSPISGSCILSAPFFCVPLASEAVTEVSMMVSLMSTCCTA